MQLNTICIFCFNTYLHIKYYCSLNYTTFTINNLFQIFYFLNKIIKIEDNEINI